MASSLTGRMESNPVNPIDRMILSKFKGGWVERLNVEQMFVLIDGVLPFEACLYYQVLPLFLEGSRLNLGMVTPDDTAASDYVRRIVSYLNYTLIIRAIPSEALQTSLSAYLNHAGRQKQSQPPHRTAANGSHRNSARARAGQEIDHNAQATFIVDSPENLDMPLVAPIKFNPEAAPPPHVPITPATLPPILADDYPLTRLQDDSPPQIAEVEADEATIDEATVDKTVGDELRGPTPEPISLEASLDSISDAAVNLADTSPANTSEDSAYTLIPPEHQEAAEQATANFPEAPSIGTEKPGGTTRTGAVAISSTGDHLPILEIEPVHLHSPVEILATLPPKELLQELLARVLAGGIGRLYFERQSQQGRVLWSQDGVLKSVLDQLSLNVFQGIINELKLMTQQSLIQVTNPKQIEIERSYQGSRLLLRFRFMPTANGEEATVQVLRGAALKFYQQQQMSNLGRDALGIAKQLQHKISEIHERSRSSPGLAGARLESLADLNHLLHNIEAQIQAQIGDISSNLSGNGHVPRDAKDDETGQ